MACFSGGPGDLGSSTTPGGARRTTTGRRPSWKRHRARLVRLLALAGIVLSSFLGPLLAAPSGWTTQPAHKPVRVGLALEPPHLDPTSTAAASTDEIVYANLFEGLTRLDEKGTVQPALAQSWEIQEAGRLWIFTLRPEVRFHNGEPLTSEIVRFSFERLLDPASLNAQRQLYAGIQSVASLAPDKVAFRLKQPDSMLAWKLAWGDAVLVTPSTVSTNKTQPVGTGPFRFESWDVGTKVSLVHNPDYWQEGPRIERLQFHFIPDPNAAYTALVGGTLDGYPNFPAPELVQVLERDERFRVEIGTTEGEVLLVMNHAHPALRNRDIRCALVQALHRGELIEATQFGLAQPIYTHFSPQHPFAIDVSGRFSHNPERARRMLLEAGIGAAGADGTEGEPLRLRLVLPPPSYARRGGELLVAQLARVGVKLDIVQVDWGRWLQEVFKEHHYDLTMIAHTEPFDIGIYARSDYYFNYDDPVFQELYRKLQTETRTTEQKRLTGQLQTHLAEACVHGFLYQLPKIGVWDRRLSGWWRDAPLQANDLTQIRWNVP